MTIIKTLRKTRKMKNLLKSKKGEEEYQIFARKRKRKRKGERSLSTERQKGGDLKGKSTKSCVKHRKEAK